MRELAIRKQFPLLRTSLLKMHNFSMFPADPKRAFCQLFNFYNFQENEKMAKLINVIFENSSPHRHFGENKLKYQILILSSDSRYFWSVALKNHYPSVVEICQVHFFFQIMLAIDLSMLFVNGFGPGFTFYACYSGICISHGI